MVITTVGQYRLEAFGLEDDTSPLELVTTCLLCGARVAYTRFTSPLDAQMADVVEQHGAVDAGMALAHCCE